jgi:hypothetical protein
VLARKFSFAISELGDLALTRVDRGSGGKVFSERGRRRGRVSLQAGGDGSTVREQTLCGSGYDARHCVEDGS